jgi:CelD/BcsL family acetyltransferase involved in cellulose biosynthesis
VLDVAGDTHAGDALLIETTDRFDFGSEEFRRLLARSRASAFQQPEWLTAFYRHMAPACDAAPLVATGRDASGRLGLVLPLVRRASGAVEYAFLGVTDYACPIVDGDLPADDRAAARLRQLIATSGPLTIGPVHQDHTEDWRSLLGIEPRQLDFGAHSVRYGTPFAEWRRANLGSRRAASLDRKARRLNEAAGLRLELLGPDDVGSALLVAADFRAGRFNDDPLRTSHGLEFYIEVATNGARSGLTRTWRLMSGATMVALVFGLTGGGTFRYILLACDYASHARHSPGRLALDHAMTAWAAEGGTEFDFTIGDEPFKAGFGCTRTPMYEFQL